MGELFFGRAEGGALQQPQQVGGGQHGTDGGDHHVRAEEVDRQAGRRVVGGQDGGELAPEPGQAGQAEGGHRGEAEDPAHVGGLHQQAAQPLDLQRVVALLHRAGEEEEHAGDEAVGHHAEDGGVDAEVGEGGDAQHHVAHVGHRGEGDQAFHVGLGQAAQRTVDDADDGQQPDPGRPLHRGLGQDRQGDADEAVGAELQQHGGQDHRALGGGLGVGIGQPGVEGEHRHLDAEAEEHAAEDQHLGAQRDVAGGDLLGQGLEVEGLGPGDPVEGQEGDQHEGRAEQGVEEELDGGVEPVLAAPHPDHEVHRQQHDLEEHEEQDQVLGHEGAEHAGVEHQHQDEERLGVAGIRDVVPRVDDDQRGDQQGQGHQRERDPVEADREPGVDHLDPPAVDQELQLLGLVVVEVLQEQHAHHGRAQAGDQGDELVGLLLLARDHHHDGDPDEGEEDHQGDAPVIQKVGHATDPWISRPPGRRVNW